jgi:hypothetical protein
MRPGGRRRKLCRGGRQNPLLRRAHRPWILNIRIDPGPRRSRRCHGGYRWAPDRFKGALRWSGGKNGSMLAGQLRRNRPFGDPIRIALVSPLARNRVVNRGRLKSDMERF